MSGIETIRRGIYWGVLLIALAVSSLYLSWQALASVNFAYPIWYDLLSIEATIETHGPHNPIRPDFHQTGRHERERLFAAIAAAIHQQGKGLDALVYHDTSGRPLGQLLTPAEITHLNDVARLVDGLQVAGWSATALFLLMVNAAIGQNLRPPAGRRLATGLGTGFAALAVAMLLTGAERVFYALHELAFPSGHQWFFYYEESLMSMMMQAPNLFGPIALAWFVLALLLGTLVWLALGWASRKVVGSVTTVSGE